MNFMLGCNYWASNAGADMWANWDENAVDFDLKQLSTHGLKYLRVFPNWRDFQPVVAFYGGSNRIKEYRHKDGSFFDNPYYLDPVAMDHFARFCEIAAKYDFKLIVGLLTGWMSGRTFTPPLLEGRNLYTDEIAMVMEQKFIKGFVSRFYNNEAIYAWDLGNECNCFSEAENREVAAAWTANIVNAIKAHDPLHKPVVSGMHSLTIDKAWSVFDQGENVDILTTHPYPYFVPFCDKDHMASFRTLVHATCEGVYYSDLGGKPCLTEEVGTLGPMTCDDETGSAFLKTNLYSNWANGSLGVLWWCGCEQVALNTAPYTWCMMERELGLLDLEGNPRKTLKTYQAFSEWLEKFGKELPPAKRDALCILTVDQEQWGTAYMAYALAKQAHVNLQFYYGQTTGELPDSKVYMLPSMAGTWVLRKETLDQLLQKIYDGATLYISNDSGYLAEFEKFSGVHVSNSMKIPETCTMELDGESIEFTRTKRSYVRSAGAEVLASDSLGMPVFTKASFGKGTVYYVNFPLESMLLDENFAFDTNRYKVYDKVFADIKKEHPVQVKNPYVGMTCHYEKFSGPSESCVGAKSGDLCYVVLINYSDKEQIVNLSVSDEYEILEVCSSTKEGVLQAVSVEVVSAHEAAVLTLKKK